MCVCVCVCVCVLCYWLYITVTSTVHGQLTIVLDEHQTIMAEHIWSSWGFSQCCTLNSRPVQSLHWSGIYDQLLACCFFVMINCPTVWYFLDENLNARSTFKVWIHQPSITLAVSDKPLNGVCLTKLTRDRAVKCCQVSYVHQDASGSQPCISTCYECMH